MVRVLKFVITAYPLCNALQRHKGLKKKLLIDFACLISAFLVIYDGENEGEDGH